MFWNCENTMAVSAGKEFERHGGSAVNGIHVSTSWAKATVATKWNKFPFIAVRTVIHGTTVAGITTVYHFINIINNGLTRV